jgi:hypothetical protein
MGTSLSRTVVGRPLQAASAVQAEAIMIAAVRRIGPIKCSRRDIFASAERRWHEDSRHTRAPSLR